MRHDLTTVRRAVPIGRLVLVVLAIAVILASGLFLLHSGTEEVFFTDDLQGQAPPSRALSELQPGEEPRALVLKHDALGGTEEFLLTGRRMIRIRNEDRWSFPLPQWSGFGIYTGEGQTRFRLSTFEDHEINLSVATTPATERLQALLSEAYTKRQPRDTTTPASETPAPRQLGPFEHPSMGYLIWLAPLVLFVLGSWMTRISLRRFRNARLRLRNHLLATGTVVDHVSSSHESAQDDGGSLYHPVVEFTTPHGRQITFESEFGSSRKRPVGRPVRVLYDPQFPEDALVYSFGPLFFVPLIAGILGLSGLIWAGALVWLILAEV